MALFDYIDNYCERLAPGLWDEPLNLISNLSFLVAAWMLWRLYRQVSPAMRQESRTLIALVALIGLGSASFHSFANRLTMLGDILPIAFFTFYYLRLALRSFLGLSPIATIACLILFTVAAVYTGYIPEPWRFNGSVMYFPCFAALLLIGGWLSVRGHPAATLLMTAAICFALSLTFRSIDMALCPSFAPGTHFLWHLINGYLLYLLASAIMCYGTPLKKL